MSTYLLTWNANKDELKWAETRAGVFATENMVHFRWSCGNTKRIQEGDRLFFLRQRMEPRGLIAIGYVERSPYEKLHWDEERAARGEQALFVDAAWEYFSVNPVIPRERLHRSPFNRVHWNTQKSGISIPDEVADILEQEFWAATGQQASSLPNEVRATTTLPEGAIRRVVVNAYERNPEARRLCIQHYGSTCVACGADLGALYGTVAAGHIHVHHLCPLSQIGTSYTVDPIRDLRPVCPSCHAVIHLAEPPYSIGQVKGMLRRQRAGT